MNWDKYAFVISSNHRQSILKEVYEKPRTPSELAEELDLSMSHISNLLKELKKEEIVECITPEKKKGRLYELTDTGEWIVKRLD